MVNVIETTTIETTAIEPVVTVNIHPINHLEIDSCTVVLDKFNHPFVIKNGCVFCPDQTSAKLYMEEHTPRYSGPGSVRRNTGSAMWFYQENVGIEDICLDWCIEFTKCVSSESCGNTRLHYIETETGSKLLVVEHWDFNYVDFDVYSMSIIDML